MECDKNVCPIVGIDGVLASGKQFDLEIRLPEDNRNVIYGVVTDFCGDPVSDAVVKLIEVVCEDDRRPVSHTFTDKDGEFVFGPLCHDKFYAIDIWVNNVKHCKICTDVKKDHKCLRGVKMDCKRDCKCDCKCDCKREKECDCRHEKECDKDCCESDKCDF